VKIRLLKACGQLCFTYMSSHFSRCRTSLQVARVLCALRVHHDVRGEGLPEIQFHIGTFTYEDASRLKPTKQFFPEERLPWVHPTDDAPR
jgi:hypothetical protein